MTRTKKRLANLLLLLLTLLVVITLSEIGMRLFLQDRLKVDQDERSLLYRYDPHLGWFPKANSQQTFVGSRPIHVEHNGRGFRDAEHRVGTNPRIVFLGDSFVWGYDVERVERFSEKLSRKLPNWAVYNLGVSGYGTDQEYLLLKQEYDFYHPQIVFLIFCTDNDEDDNSRNERYGGYFKPYFEVQDGRVQLRGTPVPKTEKHFFQNHPTLTQWYWVRLLARVYFALTTPPHLNLNNPTTDILLHMQRFVHGRGGLFLVGLQTPHLKLATFLQEMKIPYIDFGAARAHTYPTMGHHWTPEGHTLVSDLTYEFLTKGNYLEVAAALR